MRFPVRRLAALVGLLVAVLAMPRPARPSLTTLRTLYGLRPPARLSTSSTALVLIDYQAEFFTGRLPVDGGAAAVARASELLRWARREGVVVVHVRHLAARRGSPVFDEGSAGAAFLPALAPLPHEVVVTKAAAGAFTGTALDDLLRARGLDTLVVAGVMTHLAVDATARDGALLGHHVLVAHDACATRTLPSPAGGRPIAARDLHRAALAALGDRFADVLSTADIVGLPLE